MGRPRLIVAEPASGGTTPPGAGRATSRLVVASRLLLLAAAVFAVVSGFTSARARARIPLGSVTPFVCPMHPEVTSRAPGECPICHMGLEPSRHRTANASPAPVSHGGIERAQTRLLADRVRAPAWVEDDATISALLYKDDLQRVGTQEHGRFLRAGAPAAGLAVRIAAARPLPWDGSTSIARFRLDGGAGSHGPTAARPSPGDAGWIELDPRAHDVLTVPWSAVLYSPEAPYVLVASGDGGFRRQPIEVGRTLYERAQEGRLAPNAVVVLSGVQAGEPVVAGEAFVSDVERRLSADRGRAEDLAR